MNDRPSVNSKDILSSIEPENPALIEARLNRSFSDRGIRAKVALKNAYLGILLEAKTIPDKETVVTFIRQQLKDLTSESIRAIRVYGREIGQLTPVWYEVIELKKHIPSSHNLLSLTDWLSQGMEVASSNSKQLEDSVDRDNQKFLRFNFSADSTALLSLSTIKEVLNIPFNKIHPVPHMAECLLGIYDYRGEILWLADLGEQLGLTPSINYLNLDPSSYLSSSIEREIASATDTLTVIVIQDKEKSLGIVVPKVIDIEIHDTQEIHPASEDLFSPQILPFLQGYLIGLSTPVLDSSSLIEDTQLQLCMV